jgi:hypothetical protein
MTVQTFAYTSSGAAQSFVVPAFITSLALVGYGGQGTQGVVHGATANGNRGHKAEGVLAVAPGDTVYVIVGGRGECTQFRHQTNDEAHRRLVAGGGGNAPTVSNANPFTGTSTLIPDGGTVTAGGAATAAAVGAAGTWFSSPFSGGTNGNPGSGSAGGAAASRGASNSNGSCSATSGKGGTGYFGGGSGGAYARSNGAGYQNMWAAAGQGGDGSSYLGGVTGGTSSTNSRSGLGAASITYNVPADLPPNTPLLISPGASGEYDRSQTLTFSWRHSDIDPTDVQSRRLLQVRTQGTTSPLHVNVDNTTGVETYAPSAGVLPAAALEWRVQTADSAGQLSPWSTWEPFLLSDPPNAPTITNPATDGTDITVSPHTVTWTSTAGHQEAFRVSRISAGVQVWSSGAIADSAAVSYPVAFPINHVTETVRVEVRRGTLWSGADRIVDVEWLAPATPDIVVTSNLPTGAVRVEITNPTPGGGQPALAGNELWVRLVTGFDRYRPLEGIRLVSGLIEDAVFDDYGPASGSVYEYRAAAVSVTGTVAYSGWEA